MVEKSLSIFSDAKMKFSLATLTLLVFIVIFSIFVANVANLINIDRNSAAIKLNLPSETDVDRERNSQQDGLGGFRIGTSKQHLMWFMQV